MKLKQNEHKERLMGNSLKFSFFDKTYILFASCSFWAIKQRPMGIWLWVWVGGGLTGQWKTWIPWVRVGETEDSMGSPGNFRDLKDLFVNLTTCWRLEESLRRNRVISFSFVFLCLSASCNQHLAPNSVGGLYSLSCWGHIHAPVCHAFYFAN